MSSRGSYRYVWNLVVNENGDWLEKLRFEKELRTRGLKRLFHK